MYDNENNVTQNLDYNTDQPKYPCPNCKYDCDDEDCILYDYCMNWLHQKCANISDKRFRALSSSHHKKFKCKFCKMKNKNCAECGKMIRDNSQCKKLYCVSCKDWYCAQCLKLESEKVRLYLTTDTPYFCLDCSLDYFCPICSKICRDKCILCVYFKKIL